MSEKREEKFTPGPWSYKDATYSRRPRYLDQIYGSDGRLIAQSSWHSASAHYPTREVSRANFHLMTAAPALYESIKLRREYEVLPADRGGSSGPKALARRKWLEAEEQALAQVFAEGGAQ